MLTYAKTIYPCLGLTPATERWDGRPSHALHAHHPPPAHPRSVDIVSGAISCTDQRSALVADPLWAIPETRRSRGLTPVACRPADPASRPVVLLAKQQKSLPAFFILTGISHRVSSLGSIKRSCKYCSDAHSDCRNGFSRVQLPWGCALVVTRYS